jgi:threonine/homoserine/homoserine lactone efflux protein
MRGIVIGFSIAAPIGPIGILCIRRTLVEGRVVGLASGLGAATAHALYGCIAGFGLTFISDLMLGQKVWLHLIGGVFLIYLGLITLLPRHAEQFVSAKGIRPVSACSSVFFLTLTNPMTILSFAGIMTGLGVGSAGKEYISALALVLGVFFGSVLWWFILNNSVDLFRNQFNVHSMIWVNRVSGVIITVFGVAVLIS